jgi:hypothetical protein
MQKQPGSRLKKAASPDEALFATKITFVNVHENGIKSSIK